MFLEVCVDTKLTTKAWGQEISWTFGSCAGAAQGSYADNQEYPERCCLTPGEYTLTCKDSYGDGWHGGFIEIQGNKYCEDFVGSLTTNQITIAGIYAFEFCYYNQEKIFNVICNNNVHCITYKLLSLLGSA